MTLKTAFVLAVETGNQTRHLSPTTSELVIGSATSSTVHVPDADILPEHARLYKDSVGRWIVESLHAGVPINVNGSTGSTFAVHSGDHIKIGASTIRLIESVQPSIIPNAAISTPVSLAEYGERQTLIDEVQSFVEFSRTHLEELDRIADCLSSLSEAQSLYTVVCEHLSTPVDTVALVVKVPKSEGEPVRNSRVLCQRGKLLQPYQSGPMANSGSAQHIHLSQTVLESVRAQRTAFMATSETDSTDEDDARLSFIGDMGPRMVLAAPIAETNTGIDMLYIDQPAMAFRADALGFFVIVARMVSLSRKSLIMAEYKAERTALNRQLSTALEIQSNLMPKTLRLFDQVDVALYYKPAGWVGGDYCDLFKSADGRLVFAVGDVSGKGLPAAIMMANVHSMIRSMLLFSTNATEIVQKMNAMLCDTLLDRMFVTLLLGFLDPNTGVVEYVNAGHELPLRISHTGAVEILGCPVNMPLGIQSNQFVAQTTTLQQGDGLFLFSDGIPDTFSPDDEKFGYDRLIESVSTAALLDSETIVDMVEQSMNRFRETLPPGDDATMLSLKWHAR